MSCLPLDAIERYAADELPAPERSSADQHIAGCKDCQDANDEEQELERVSRNPQRSA